LANYRLALASGNVESALASAMHFPFLYYASGTVCLSTLNALLEPKTRVVGGQGETAEPEGLYGHFPVLPTIPVAYNLQVKSNNPKDQRRSKSWTRKWFCLSWRGTASKSRKVISVLSD
jgi:hypothetical protein